ncbi:transposase [Limimaricola cinnabarinus]|uniref:transposase n=1 Tax=Limimaricola cinnabarinus TaxID=1125964 RepID=UPI00228381B9|nr:transposase [Limimaricola cinnabarinus]
MPKYEAFPGFSPPFGGSPRCSAAGTVPNVETRERIGAELRTVWNASTLAKAETALAELVASYRTSAPKLAAWLEENAPEGLAIFTLPEHHRRLRTSNPMERSVQQEAGRNGGKPPALQAAARRDAWSHAMKKAGGPRKSSACLTSARIRFVGL